MILFRGAKQLVTLQGPSPRRGPLQDDVRVISDGAMLVHDGKIVELGSTRRLENRRVSPRPDQVDLRGKVVVPAFIDACNRLGSLCSSPSEPEVAAQRSRAGDVRIRLQQHSVPALARGIEHWVLRWYAQGATAMQLLTSGDMGLTREIRILKAVRSLRERHPGLSAAVSLGLPAESAFRHDSAALYKYLCSEFLPTLQRRRLARICQIDLETLPLAEEHLRQLVHIARHLGFDVRIEGDRSMHAAAVQTARQLQLGVVHGLNAMRSEDVRTLARDDMIAVLNPGDSLDRDFAEQPPVRDVLDEGGAVALGTGFGPPLSSVASMPAAICLACQRWQMTPAEALGAATVNAAACLPPGTAAGKLDVGEDANFVVLELDDYRELAHCLGYQPCQHVYLRGEIVHPARHSVRPRLAATQQSAVPAARPMPHPSANPPPQNGPWIEAVPNFSEGRDPLVFNAIRDAAAEVTGAAVLDFSADADHNRCVLTLAGEPQAVSDAVFAAARVAVEAIDLKRHTGVHPRIGALDVAPFVPLIPGTTALCVETAHAFAKRLWDELRVPSYFYERAAPAASRRLENVRRGGFEVLAMTMRTPGRQPDVGESRPHPTAGAAAVGVRKPLIAFNLFLRTKDVAIAQRIAKKVRQSSGGLPHVKALGLYLQAAGAAQVSVNLTDFEVTPLHEVVARITEEAAAEGVEIGRGELIGLVPRRVFAAAGASFFHLPAEARFRTIEDQISAARRKSSP